jgi:hypothetical protein
VAGNIKPSLFSIRATPYEASAPSENRIITQTEYNDGSGIKHAIDAWLVGGDVVATPSGLSVAGKISIVNINDSGWTALPAASLLNRNGMGIQNPNGTQLKLNFDNTEPGYVGWSVNPNGEAFLDVRDTVTVYAKAQSGNIDITIMEVS